MVKKKVIPRRKRAFKVMLLGETETKSSKKKNYFFFVILADNGYAIPFVSNKPPICVKLQSL